MHVSPVALREALCELGPAFIKLGQILCSRDEFLASPFRRELAKLWDQVPPFPEALVRAVVESELGSSSDVLFAEFSGLPVASGSIGQVHRARLHDGTEVAVKVQRPGIAEILARDSAVIRHLSNLFERESSVGDRASRLVSEFIAATQSELDYSQEADNLDRFGWQLEHEPGVCVPRTFRSYSSKRVLTMTYLEGVRLSEIDRRIPNLDPARLASSLANIVLKQVFSFGYFHGDPHPANVIVTEDGSLGFYDLGLVGELSSAQRENLAVLLLGLLQQQADTALGALLKFSPLATPADLGRIRDDTENLMVRFFRGASAEKSVHLLLGEILKITSRYQLTLPPVFYHVFKVLASLETTCRNLDPEFNLATLAVPHLRRNKPAGPVVQLDAATVLGVGLETLTQMKELPAAIQSTLTMLNQGQVRIQFDTAGLERAVAGYERTAYRLNLTLFACAIMLGGLVVVGLAVHARLITLWGAAEASISATVFGVLLLGFLHRVVMPGSVSKKRI